MPLIETGPGLWERLDDAPVAPEAPSDEAGERSDREQLSARVREALRNGSIDDLEDAIVRETVGYLTDPYIDSNTLMGVTDLNPRLAAAWNNGARDLAKDERRREVSRARILSVFAPPAHNAVRQHQNYVIGQGVAKPTAAIGNADIQAVIDDLWSDPANHEFTTHNGQKRADANQIIDGELFVAIAIDEQDGHCKWRTVDPLDIDDLVTDPDDACRVLYYRVRQAKTDYDFGRGIVKDGEATDKYVYFRDWRNTDPALDPYNGKAQPPAPEHMVMAHWPINTLGLRGIPDMVCAAPWIAAHKSFMNNRTILHEALSKIAFVKTIKGGAPAVNASALAEQSSLTNSQYSGQERNPQPAPYAIMTKNAGVDIEQLKVDSGASNAQTDGEMLAQMFSTGVGLPTHYSIMSVEAHRLATATAMELPVLKMFLSSQQGWLDMLRDLIDFALLQAATAGRIKAKIVTKHGRQLIDWENSPASPEKQANDDQPAAPSNVTPIRRKKAAPDSDAQASVREALEDADAVAQAEHIEKVQEPTAQAEQTKKKRGNYTIDMPPILQKDIAQTIAAVVQALQAGTLTPELAANQVMIALGFDDVSDKMDEWRSYVQTQAQQAVDRVAQEHDMAQQQLAAKAGPPGGGPAAPPTPFGGAPPSSPQATAREAFTEAQLAVLAGAGLTLVREAGGGGHWITIEQDGESTHIFIGAHGMVTKGPKHLIGANIAHLPPIPGKRSVTHHPDGHVPSGHDSHPHYTEHEEKKHVYGKHGPGVGYDVDNPLPKKTAEQAEAGLQKSVEAAKEHKAAQDAEQAKADAEAKAETDEAEKKAAIGKKNSAALAEAHEHKPFVVTQHPETGKYHVTHGLTATSHTTHDTEVEAQDTAKIKNDNHYSDLQKQYNDDEADKGTPLAPYIMQTLTPGKYSVVHSDSYKALSEHDTEDDAFDAMQKANKETYKAFLKKANEDNQKAFDATTPDAPYCAIINKPGEYELYNGQTETPTGHEPYDTLAEAEKNAAELNKQKVQAKTDKLHMAELLGHASTVQGQHYLMTLADHTLFGASAATLTTAEKAGLETLSTFLFNKANGKPEATTNQLHDAIVKAALPLIETHSQQGFEVMQQSQDNLPSLQQTIAHEEALAAKKAGASPAAAASNAPAAEPPTYKNMTDVPVTALKDGPNTTTPGAAHVVKLLVGDENGAHVLVGAVGMDGTAPNEHSEKWFIRQPTSADGISGAVVHGFTKQDAIWTAQHIVAQRTEKLSDTVEFHKFASALQAGAHAGNVKKAQDYNNKADAAASPTAPWVVNQSTQNIGEWKAWHSQTGDFSQTFDSEQAAKAHADKLNSGTNPKDYLKQKYGAKYEQRERWREEAKASLPKPADTAKLAKKSQVGKVRTKVKPDEAKRGREYLAELHKDVTDSEAKEQIMVQQAERMKALGVTDDDVKPFLDQLRNGAGYAVDHELDSPLESAANYLTAMWARSSADSHEISIAMQQVARDLFGQDAWTDRPDHVGESAWNDATKRAADPAFRKAAEAYLHSAYHATQAAFKAAGITHIAVYRGVTHVTTPSIVDDFKKAKASVSSTYDHWQTYGEVGPDDAWTNPLSSWAFASQIPSKNFAGNNDEYKTAPNVVYYATMPVSRIVTTFRSGYGCKLEDECCVVGHRSPLAYTMGRESINTYMNLDKKLGAT